MEALNQDETQRTELSDMIGFVTTRGAFGTAPLRYRKAGPDVVSRARASDRTASFSVRTR
jgi:hypothetical protein